MGKEDLEGGGMKGERLGTQQFSQEKQEKI
jgi:hypothetical protein